MLLVVSFLLSIGFVLIADGPGAPERDERPPTAAVFRAPTIRHDAPAPRESARAVRIRLRAYAPEREDDSSHSSAAKDTVAPSPSPRCPCRGSPFASVSSSDPLIYTFCTLLC